MKVETVIRFLLLWAAAGLLSGCASYPVSKSLREQARPLTLAQVTANPGTYTGATVIWGGQIINTVNGTNGGDIYVFKLPLNRHEQPMRYGVSPGRFIAHRNGFIDPEIFRRGRLITVAGTITGVETEPLQKMRYPYPVLGIEELHLWHRRPPSYYYPAWDWGWYGPGWDWGWYGPGLGFPDNEEYFKHHEFEEHEFHEHPGFENHREFEGHEFPQNHESFEHGESGEGHEHDEH